MAWPPRPRSASRDRDPLCHHPHLHEHLAFSALFLLELPFLELMRPCLSLVLSKYCKRVAGRKKGVDFILLYRKGIRRCLISVCSNLMVM
jgi:hypothetical protein